jgi:hypothetical protein
MIVDEMLLAELSAPGSKAFVTVAAESADMVIVSRQ